MEVHLIGAKLGRGPTLVLNDVCLSLLRELFPSLGIEALGRPLVARRVSWAGEGLKRIVAPALSIQHEVLLDALPLEGVLRYEEVPTDVDYRWRIYAGAGAGASDQVLCERISAGARVVLSSAVALSNEQMNTYSIESVRRGWLLLAPVSPGEGTVQAMVPRPRDPVLQLDEMLRQSKLIGPELQLLGKPTIVAAAPYAVVPVAGEGWLAIGRSAAGLDPIGGEGSPFSLRTALLAAAIIGDVGQARMTAEEGREHYQYRVTLTVLAHLKGCATFYSTAFGDDGPWQEELRQTARAHHEIVDLVKPPAPQELKWTLAGDHLERR